MASRATSGLRAAVLQSYCRHAAVLHQSRSATTATADHPGGAKAGSKLPRGDYMPMYVALGLIALSVTLGLSTARQQLANSSNIRVDKKKRETVPEVAAPDLALDEAKRFIGNSLFRKVAHMQDDRSLGAGVADPVAKYSMKKAVTLKDVGVETPGIEQSREGVIDRIFKKNHA